jgi:hypothetical protein
MTRPLLEVADIVRAQGNHFIRTSCRWIHCSHRKVLLAIARCRTAALGGRGTLLPHCQRLLLDHPRPATTPTNIPRPPACFRCPQCATPMVRVESFSAWNATQLLPQRIQLDSS